MASTCNSAHCEYEPAHKLNHYHPRPMLRLHTVSWITRNGSVSRKTMYVVKHGQWLGNLAVR